MSEALLPDRNMSLLLGLAVVFVLLTLVGTLGLMGGIALMLSTSGSEAPPVAVEQVAAPEADGVPLGWADGLPPPWTDHRFVVRSDRVELVGGAKADSPDAGLELARLDMMAVLLERLQGLSPAGESLPKVPLEGQALTDAVVRFEAQTGGIGVPERTDGAVRHDEDGVFVVARYALPIDEWQRLGDIYRQRTYFRGVVLRPPPPAFGAATGAAAVVTDTASFMRAMRVGDGITAIEGQQVSSFAEAKEVLTKRWSRTDPGRWMSVQIVRDGRADEVEFRKPGVTPELR